MTISKERIRRAGRAMMRCADPVPMSMFTFDEVCDLIQAALEADAPALIAAKIEGMREVQAKVGVLTYPRSIPADLHLGSAVAAWREHTREARERAIKVSVNIDARIDELRAEMGKRAAPTAATRIKADER